MPSSSLGRPNPAGKGPRNKITYQNPAGFNSGNTQGGSNKTMKKLFSKWLSGMLALVMVIGLLPAAGFAASGNNSGSGDRPGDNGTTSITVFVRDSSDNTKVLPEAGVKLERVTSGRYHDFGIKYTDKTGSVTWDNLESGLYRITQTSTVNGYKMNTVMQQRWFGTGEDNHAVDILNYPQVL